MKHKITALLMILVMMVSSSTIAFAESDINEKDLGINELSGADFVFADKIVDGNLPTFIDGDEIDIDNTAEVKDGGGMKLIATRYVGNQRIGNIFNWTSASSVTKSSGFNISGKVTKKIFGINMSITMKWNTDTKYVWKKPSGKSQFKVVGYGDIRVRKYLNQRNNTYYYVKHTINKTDKLFSR